MLKGYLKNSPMRDRRKTEGRTYLRGHLGDEINGKTSAGRVRRLRSAILTDNRSIGKNDRQEHRRMRTFSNKLSS